MCIAILNHPFLMSLYNPFSVIRGMVYYCYTNVIGNSHPNWLIFFRGVETSNQNLLTLKVLPFSEETNLPTPMTDRVKLLIYWSANDQEIRCRMCRLWFGLCFCWHFLSQSEDTSQSKSRRCSSIFIWYWHRVTMATYLSVCTFWTAMPRILYRRSTCIGVVSH